LAKAWKIARFTQNNARFLIIGGATGGTSERFSVQLVTR
jgi:hypothetical protein